MAERIFKLWVMRHGEATPAGLGNADFERPLSKHGLTQLSKLGEHLQHMHSGQPNLLPTQAYCSHAIRAQQTFKTLFPFLNACSLEVRSELYEKGPKAYSAVCAGLSELEKERHIETTCALIIGHNPSVSEWIYTLSNDSMHFSPGQLLFLEARGTSWVEAIYGCQWKLIGERA